MEQNHLAYKELSFYFDLSKIDWNKCAINANSSLMIDICKSIDGNNIDIRELEKKYNEFTRGMIITE